MRALLAALVLTTCAPRTRLPLPVSRGYDTRTIGTVMIDSAVASAAFRAMVKASPHETAMCLYGNLERQSDLNGPFWKVNVRRLSVAFTIWADSFHVMRDTLDAAPFGCTDEAEGQVLLGHGHSHPWSGAPCGHSHDDQLVFHGDPRVILTIVFCGDGSGEFQFRDGRRVPYQWAH